MSERTNDDGPWYADANGVYENGTLIAVVNTFREDAGFEAAQNKAARRAMIMAAAHDMLAALKKAERVLREEGFEDDADEARDAIAKAQVTAWPTSSP